MPEANVFERISSAYYQLTAAEKKVADYIIIHQKESQFLSISQLAGACGVAEATVSRFVKRLRFQGYHAFRLAIARYTAGHSASSPLSGEVDPEDSLPDLCRKLLDADIDAMEQTLALLRPDAVQQAADLLEAAGKVLCMGQGSSMIMAYECAHLFSTAFGKYYPVADSHMQAIAISQAEAGDVVLYFSYSGATRELLEAAKQARLRGLKIILVTRFPKSPGGALADVVLQCGSHESPLQLGSVAGRMAQLYLLDVLFSEVCRRNLEGCRASRKQASEALAAKHV